MLNISVFSRKTVILPLLLVLFIDGLGVSMVLPLFSEMFLDVQKSILPVITSERQRNFIYGFSLMSFSLGMFFGAPVLGQLSDKLGRKKILIYSLLGTILGYSLSGIGIYIKSYILFIIGRIVGGITAGSIPIAQAAIIDISHKENRAGNIGLILVAVTSGYVFEPIISNLLSKHINIFSVSLSAPFYATAFLSLLCIILLLPFKETITLDCNKKINFLSSWNIFTHLKELLSGRVFIIAFLFFQLGWTMYFQYIPHFLSSLELEQIITKVLVAIGSGMAISFCFLIHILQRSLTTVNGSIITNVVIIVAILSSAVIQISGRNNDNIRFYWRDRLWARLFLFNCWTF